MGQPPLPQLLFGPTLDTVLDLPYPLDNLVTYTEPRGSETVQYPSGTEDSWYQGTDYCLEGDVRWLPLGGPTNPGYQLTQAWSAWEQFLALGRQRQPQRVRYVPDRTFPTNYVDGWLAEPFSGAPGAERGGEGRLHLKLRTKDRHYGVAQRGLPHVAERLIKARAKTLVVAAGLIERPFVFAGNDLPGVMLSTAVRRLINLHAVRPGSRAVVVTANEDDAAATNPGFSYVCNRRWVARHIPKTHT